MRNSVQEEKVSSIGKASFEPFFTFGACRVTTYLPAQLPAGDIILALQSTQLLYTDPKVSL